MRRWIIIIIFTLECVLLSGCWSSNPIEDVNMEVGIALDSADETRVEEEFRRKGGDYPKRDTISSTFQFIVPKGNNGSKEKGSSMGSFHNMTETGDSIFESVRELALRSDRPPIGHHLKVIVVGDQLARSRNLSELIEFFSRDNDIRPSVLVMVSKGKARDVLSEAMPGQIPALVLSDIYNNRDRSSRIWEPLSIAKLVGPLHGKTSFILQNVIMSEKEHKFAGAGVFLGKTGKLIGFLNESELEGLIWLTGKGRGGVLKTRNTEDNRLITYEIFSVNSKIKAIVKGEDISFHVTIESRGRHAEIFSSEGEALDEDYVIKNEEALEKQVEQMVRHTADTLQNKFHADPAGFGKNLQIQYPAVWNKVKEDWDETFSKIPITYEVKVDIKDYGASNTASD
jgi:spore germination protein